MLQLADGVKLFLRNVFVAFSACRRIRKACFVVRLGDLCPHGCLLLVCQTGEALVRWFGDKNASGSAWWCTFVDKICVPTPRVLHKYGKVRRTPEKHPALDSWYRQGRVMASFLAGRTSYLACFVRTTP